MDPKEIIVQILNKGIPMDGGALFALSKLNRTVFDNTITELLHQGAIKIIQRMDNNVELLVKYALV